MSETEARAPKQERALATRLKLLDAAVDELVERGYLRLTTSSVAERAGVSRGAQQRYFPSKDILVEQALAHLMQRQLSVLHGRMESLPAGRAGIEEALDLVFELYLGEPGPLFAVVIELAYVARTELPLRRLVSAAEKEVGVHLEAAISSLLGPDLLRAPAFSESWAVALSTARGLALLQLLGHPADAVEAQWAFTRPKLLEMFAEGRDGR